MPAAGSRLCYDNDLVFGRSREEGFEKTAKKRESAVVMERAPLPGRCERKRRSSDIEMLIEMLEAAQTMTNGFVTLISRMELLNTHPQRDAAVVRD